ncbi:DNA-processing protein DprA [Nonomuraea zeae]|nr:DNA-processing protein DprA [Nonomuraea zeae]
MSILHEQIAILALVKTTDGPWHHISRLVQSHGSAARLTAGDFAHLREEYLARATALVARLDPDDMGWAERLIAATTDQDTQLITVLEEKYPSNLDFAPNLQPFLWIRGQLQADDDRAVTIVGDGEHADAQASEAATALARTGLTLVAGLASAVDAVVHEAALAAGGRTIAALDHGISVPPRPENATVAKEIAASGALVSQFWPNASTTDETIMLSRIVTSGLAEAVFVADGHEDGVAAAQTEVALKQGKHVFVPQRLQQEQPWVARLGFRGGITAVQDIDDLSTQVVNLIDMTRQSTIF